MTVCVSLSVVYRLVLEHSYPILMGAAADTSAAQQTHILPQVRRRSSLILHFKLCVVGLDLVIWKTVNNQKKKLPVFLQLFSSVFLELTCTLSRVSDPYSFDTNPDQYFRRNTDPNPDPIRTQGFEDKKFKKNYSWKKLIFFYIKNYNLPIPRLP
jgi:hypothetical protein